MASSRISSTSKPPSTTIRTSSEPSEFTSSDFENIFESSTAEPTSTSVARRPIVTISGRPTISSTSSTFTSAVASASPQFPISTSTSVPPPNFFPVTSSTVSRPSFEASASHNQNVLSPGMIAVIAASSFSLILIVVAFIVLLLRCRRNRVSRTKEGGSRDLDSEEKYAVRSHYTPYGDSQHKEPLMDQGMAPLLNVPSINQHSRSPSLSSDLESHLYHEGPTSPFLNESERRADLNAALNPETTPYTFAEVGDTALDAVVLLPTSTPPMAQSRASAAASKLAPLYIPERPYNTVPPSRRRSKGKNWKRAPSNVDANAPPADTDYDSDDSASLYSQASASTHRTFTAPTRQTTNQPFPYPSIPLPSIPQSPYQKVSTVEPSSKIERPSGVWTVGPPTNSGYLPSPVESLGAREEEGNGGLGREETLLVATLLQSRLSRVPKQGLAPTRSSSIVSHIERAGSIKPVLTSVETAGGASRYGPGSRARRARDAVRSQIMSGSELRNGESDPQKHS